MHAKSLIVLFAVTAAAVVVAVFLSFGGHRPVSSPANGGPVLPEVAQRPAAVARIALVRGETKTTLLRRDDRWVVEEKGNYPADQGKVGRVLAGLAKLAYAEPKTSRANLYARLDLDDPDKKGAKSTLVTIADASGSLLGELIIGRQRPDELGDDDGVYVRRPGNPQSWLAHGTVDVTGDTVSWLDQKLIDMPDVQVRSVVLTQPDGSKITIERDQPQDPFRLAELPAGKKLKSETALGEPAGALGGFHLADLQPARDIDLAGGGAGHAQYSSFDGLTVTIDLVERNDGTWARFSAAGTGSAEKTAADLNARWSGWIYKLPAYQAGLLKTNLAQLLEPVKAS